MENANRSSNVTVADVAAACDELGVSPAETNAAKVRQALGRGGMTTVQKHLQTLRDEAARAQQPVVQVTVPPPPTDLKVAFDSVWNAAYSAASNQFSSQLLTAWSERDALRGSVTTFSEDVAALAEQVDVLEMAATHVKADRETAITQRNEAIQSLLACQQAADNRVAELVTITEKEALAVAHQAELAGLERTIERQTLQSTIDRLTDQIGELKSLLSMQARPVPAQS